MELFDFEQDAVDNNQELDHTMIGGKFGYEPIVVVPSIAAVTTGFTPMLERYEFVESKDGVYSTPPEYSIDNKVVMGLRFNHPELGVIPVKGAVIALTFTGHPNSQRVELKIEHRGNAEGHEILMAIDCGHRVKYTKEYSTSFGELKDCRHRVYDNGQDDTQDEIPEPDKSYIKHKSGMSYPKTNKRW